MSVYDGFGVRPIINAAGPATRLGGPRMLPEAAQAMADAADHCVPIDVLQATASSRIADATGAEAGYVTAGASAGLTLATAACLAGLDLGRMDALPDTHAMPNEVIVSRSQRNGYDHAIRAAGAVLVEVGMNEIASGAGARQTEPWEIEQAISDRTAAIAYFATPMSEPLLEDVVEVSQRAGIPLIVDAAGQLPPASNLRRYGMSGADVVVFSGGKAMRGPQGTGLLAGRRDLVMSVALQNLDLDEHPETWDPPRSLIERERLRGVPRHGIGRGFKVSKEEIVAVLVALERFVSDDGVTRMEIHVERLERVREAFRGSDGVEVRYVEAREPQGYPVLELRVDPGSSLGPATELVRELKRESPSIHVAEHRLRDDTIVIHPIALDDEDVRILIDRFTRLLARDRPAVG